jgi:hypothetical protein
MGRQIKVLLIGAAFTVVAMGFAYAVPRAMSTAAGGSARDSIRLLTGTEESPAPSDDCDEPVSSQDPVGSEEPAASEEPVASEQPASEAPVASEEPCDDGDGDEPDDPANEEENGEDGDGNGGSTTNHGSAVRVAAHCDVHGRAHGELVRSVAQDKDATVASAEQACADALSAGDAKDKAKGNANPKKDKKSHDPGAAHGNSGHGSGPGSSNQPHGPPAPKAAKPVKVKASNGGGSTSSAPENSASKGKSKNK